jgi:hypothetical protein
MLDLDRIFGKPNKNKKKSNVMDIDRILPSFPKTELKPVGKEKVVIHNHYHFETPKGFPTIPNQKPMKKFRLSTLNGESGPFGDPDRDLVPNAIDPAPHNPNIPRKKMIWEKTMQSIYRSDKDD